MQYGHKSWLFSMDMQQGQNMQHGHAERKWHATWRSSKDMRCSMDMQHDMGMPYWRTAWTCSKYCTCNMDMQHLHTWACGTDIQHGHAAYMYVQVEFYEHTTWTYRKYRLQEIITKLQTPFPPWGIITDITNSFPSVRNYHGYYILVSFAEDMYYQWNHRHLSCAENINTEITDSYTARRILSQKSHTPFWQWGYYRRNYRLLSGAENTFKEINTQLSCAEDIVAKIIDSFPALRILSHK